MKKKKIENNDLFDIICTPPKVILVDYSVFVHKSIFASKMIKYAKPATYYCLNSLLTCLKLINPKKSDLVIFAIDSYGKGNWRKDYDPAYKANRKENRAKQGNIDWEAEFEAMNKLINNINISTPFIPIQVDRLEADDIISYACRYYKDCANIILTTDSDMNQLYSLGNVKILNPKTKKYREVEHPLKELSKKIVKETTDNLITPITNKEEYNRRKAIVSLLELPKEVEAPLKTIFTNLKPKTKYDLDKLMFPSLLKKYNQIYKE